MTPAEQALKIDVDVLRRDLTQVAKQIVEGHQELARVQKEIESERSELKRIQLLKDPLLQGYEKKISERKSELESLEQGIHSTLGRGREEFANLTFQLEERAKEVKKNTELADSLQKKVDELMPIVKKLLDEMTKAQKELNRAKEETVEEVSCREKRVENLEEQAKYWLGQVESLELREEKVSEREEAVGARERAVFEKERELALKSEVTEDMFQSMKSRFKKKNVIPKQANNHI